MIALTGLVLASCKEIFDFESHLVNKQTGLCTSGGRYLEEHAMECLVGVAVHEWGSSAQLAKDRPVWTEECEKGAGS